jgi:heme/copper-type cytochrome/quinol oxidase subunit 4
MTIAVLGYGIHPVRQERRQRKQEEQTSNWIDQLTLLVCALVLAGLQALVFLWLNERSPELSRFLFYVVSSVAAVALL